MSRFCFNSKGFCCKDGVFGGLLEIGSGKLIERQIRRIVKRDRDTIWVLLTTFRMLGIFRTKEVLFSEKNLEILIQDIFKTSCMMPFLTHFLKPVSKGVYTQHYFQCKKQYASQFNLRYRVLIC